MHTWYYVKAAVLIYKRYFYKNKCNIALYSDSRLREGIVICITDRKLAKTTITLTAA